MIKLFTKMFNTFKTMLKTESNDTGDGGTEFIEPTYAVEGKGREWFVTETQGSFTRSIAGYSRKRDAVRGAQRRGITLTNV